MMLGFYLKKNNPMKYFLTFALSLLSLSVFSQTITLISEGSGNSYEAALANAFVNLESLMSTQINGNEEITTVSKSKSYGAFSIEIKQTAKLPSDTNNEDLDMDYEFDRIIKMTYLKGEVSWDWKGHYFMKESKNKFTESNSIDFDSHNFKLYLIKEELLKAGIKLDHRITLDYDNNLLYCTHEVDIFRVTE